MRAPDLALYRSLRLMGVLPAGLIAGREDRPFQNVLVRKRRVGASREDRFFRLRLIRLLSRLAAWMQYPQCRGYGLLQAG